MATTSKRPTRWTSMDDAIWDARIRQRMTWREVGNEVGMSFSQARARFYKRMEYITPAEVEEMRAEENGKLDEQERHLLLVMAQARQEGQYTAAVAALNGLERVAGRRAKLNGLDQPIRHEVSITGEEARAEIDATLDAYLLGVTDAGSVD